MGAGVSTMRDKFIFGLHALRQSSEGIPVKQELSQIRRGNPEPLAQFRKHRHDLTQNRVDQHFEGVKDEDENHREQVDRHEQS